MQYDAPSNTPVIQAFEANTYAVAANYGNQVTISTGGSNGYSHIAGAQIGSTRSACAIWLNDNGVNTVVQAAIGQENVVPSPMPLAVVQGSNNFGLFTEYFNTLTWTGTAPANALQWLIFRNGVFIGTAPITVFQFIDHNAVQNEPVVYGVALQLQDLDQSQIAIINYP
jgi:hypothetical protein